MPVVLAIFGGIFVFIAFTTIATASGAPAELFGGEMLIVSAILFAAAAIVQALDRLRRLLDPNKKAAIPGPGGL